MTVINTAIVQFPRNLENPASNLALAREYVGRIKKADLVLFPEDWMGTRIISWQEFIETSRVLKNLLPGESLLVAGAAYVRDGDACVSRGAFVYGDPPRIEPFEKLFPSHAIGERKFIARGNRAPVIDFRGTKVAACVCVDLFYPETVRNLALAGAMIVLNPANIPAARMELWQHLGAARAAENTIFVVMANNTLTSYPDKRPVSGHSFIARPDGYDLHRCGSEPGIYYFQLDTALISKTRERWRYLEDIRQDRG